MGKGCVMAFVSGYETKYHCPLCDEVCKERFNTNSFSVSYYHEYSTIFINGYPGFCDNAGKELKTKEVNKKSHQIIELGGFNKW